jgi:hypothetical protein
MILKVISGGQTGVDQAALRAARACGIATGGWAPKGWLTEDGPQKELLESFGLRQIGTASYKARTIANVREADFTLWVGKAGSTGFYATNDACLWNRKPMAEVPLDEPIRELFIRDISRPWFKVINVAGNRESKDPGIGERAEAFLVKVFLAAKEPHA